MFTRCSHCKHQHQLSLEDLRSTRGMLKCTACDSLFDSLEFISESPLIDSELPEAPSNHFAESSPVENNPPQHVWLTGCVMGSVLLIFQFFYFQTAHLVQRPATRPVLAQLCSVFGCSIDDYKNLEEISILSGSLENQSPHAFSFNTILLNEGPFPQPYPKIQLSLVNFTGQAFAERLFSAQDYLAAEKYLAPDETTEISISIAATEQKIGGYNFKLYQ